MVEVFPELSKDKDLLDKRVAQTLVDAALICRQELYDQHLGWEAKKALVEALQRDPLLTAQLFLPPHEG